MKTTKDPTFVNDIPTTESVRVRKPFKVSHENQRRFVRIKISAPMSLQKIKDTDGGFWPEGEWHVANGTVLNISAGGVLVDLDQAVTTGDIVVMQFTLQEVEPLEHILGRVKRADRDESGCLAGIEFISREYLQDHFSEAEIELMGGRPTSFDESVRAALNRYVRNGA